MSDFEFSCPKCGGSLVVAEKGAGRMVKCVLCAQFIQIPQQRSACQQVVFPASVLTQNQTHVISSDMMGTGSTHPSCNKPLQSLPPPTAPSLTTASQSDSSTTEQNCRSCGAENISEARFCNKCGAQITSPLPTPRPTAIPVVMSPLPQPSTVITSAVRQFFRPTIPATPERWKRGTDMSKTGKNLISFQGRISKILFSFQGRISRQTFWSSQFVITVLAYVVTFIIAAKIPADDIWPIFLSWMFLVLWAMFATQAKRWHDRDKSGWMSLVVIIPLVGQIYGTVELGFLRGTVGANKYGEDPLLRSGSHSLDQQ